MTQKYTLELVERNNTYMAFACANLCKRKKMYCRLGKKVIIHVSKMVLHYFHSSPVGIYLLRCFDLDFTKYFPIHHKIATDFNIMKGNCALKIFRNIDLILQEDAVEYKF